MTMMLLSAASLLIAATEAKPAVDTARLTPATAVQSNASTSGGLCEVGRGEAVLAPWPKALTEAERANFAAAIALTFATPRISGDWPASQVRNTAPCHVSQFKVGDGYWSLNAGTGGAPALWAVSTSYSDIVVVAAGPAPGDAPGLLGSPWVGDASSKRAYYLASKSVDGLTNIIAMFSALPSGPQVAQAMVDRTTRAGADFATFSDNGAAVSIGVPVEGGKRVQIFNPGSSDGTVRINGADGDFFKDTPTGLRMKGAGFICPEQLNGLSRAYQEINDMAEGSRDFGCWYEANDGTGFGLYTMERPDASDDRALYASRFSALAEELGVSDLKLSRYRNFSQSASWTGGEDKIGLMTIVRIQDWLVETILVADAESISAYRDYVKVVVSLREDDLKLQGKLPNATPTPAPAAAQGSVDLKAR